MEARLFLKKGPQIAAQPGIKLDQESYVYGIRVYMDRENHDVVKTWRTYVASARGITF